MDGVNSGALKAYKYNGARALVLLHEQQLRSCLKTWRIAKKTNVQLPETGDRDYLNLDTLLQHVLRSAGGYMNWICKQLYLADPQILPAPGPAEIAAGADAYLEHLLERWRLPLAGVEPEKFEDRTYDSRWGVPYCIDAMLEHAVMHPMRHEFQLQNLIRDQR